MQGIQGSSLSTKGGLFAFTRIIKCGSAWNATFTKIHINCLF